MMQEELKGEWVEVVSPSYFYALWEKKFKNTVIPKVRTYVCTDIYHTCPHDQGTVKTHLRISQWLYTYVCVCLCTKVRTHIIIAAKPILQVRPLCEVLSREAKSSRKEECHQEA